MDLLDTIFLPLTEDMYELTPGFGEELAGDEKILDSYAPNDHHKDCSDGRCKMTRAILLRIICI